MTTTMRLIVGTAALVFASLPAFAEGADSSVELAFMPSTQTVTLLNEGGKYVAVDLKHIDKGGKCQMEKDSIIAKVGAGAAPDTTRVRYAAPNLKSGGCPFLTEFELSNADYTTARAAFVDKTAEASKKLDDLKKQLGDKWNEVTGAAKPSN
jgi:hypothetical protein